MLMYFYNLSSLRVQKFIILLLSIACMVNTIEILFILYDLIENIRNNKAESVKSENISSSE